MAAMIARKVEGPGIRDFLKTRLSMSILGPPPDPRRPSLLFLKSQGHYRALFTSVDVRKRLNNLHIYKDIFCLIPHTI